VDSVDKVPGRKRGELPIACNLSEPDMVKRWQEVAEEIFGWYRRVEELVDGYSFSFPGDAEWANKLVDFSTRNESAARSSLSNSSSRGSLGPIGLG
jgi:hypothetical protein